MIGLTYNYTKETCSPNDLGCLQMFANGHTPAEIGLSLGLTELRVVLHLKSVEEKLGARNQLHAIVLAMRLHLIQ
jgi:DNA-binding CsgD family transcriptional regulator